MAILTDDTKVIISLGFTAILVLMSLIIYTALNQLQELNHDMSEMVEATNSKVEAANTMRDAIRLRASSLRSLALAEDPFERDEEYLRFVNHARAFREGRERLLASTLDAQEKAIHDRLIESVREAQPLIDRVAELLLGEEEYSDEVSAAMIAAVRRQDILLARLNELVEYERNLAKQTLNSANDEYQKSRWLLFILAGLALALSLFIAATVIRRSSEKSRQIHYQANHDALTGLLNRRAFEHELNTLVKMDEKAEHKNALLYMDLDRFKVVNDTCGHMAGDELLRQITSVFRNRLRQTDIIARLGGDEFGILLKNCSEESAYRVAEALRESASNFQFDWDRKKFSVGVSIGVVPIDRDSGSMSMMLSTVDMACLEAKRSGRNRVRVANVDDQHIAERRNEMASIGLIKEALEDDRLVLYYQSVVPINGDMDSGTHVEILVRMINAEGDLVPPGSFIPVAERYDLMVDIDKWVLSHAVQWLEQYSRSYDPPRLMINLSGQSLSDEGFLDFVLATLNGADISSSHVCFEITETAAIANLNRALAFLDALKDRGCEFALDDFGSGLSSFTYLKGLPVDYLKIDGTFVREIVKEPIDYAMVKSINEIGHVMNKRTIAEFVEDRAIFMKLKAIGVDYAQGYGIAVPKPLYEFEAFRYQVENN